MPRFTCNKRKRTALNREPHAHNSLATDGNTASNDGRSDNVPRSGEASDGTGSSTKTRNNQDGNRTASNSAGGTSRNSAGSSGSAGLSSVGDNRLREDSNNRGQPPAPLTKDDIPALVREITRQLRSDNTEVHPDPPLVPGTQLYTELAFVCHSQGSRLDPLEGPAIFDIPGPRVH